jgi:hypothetical protein
MSGVDADAAQWTVVVAVPKEVRELSESAAEEVEKEEAALEAARSGAGWLVRRGPLFGDQIFALWAFGIFFSRG